MTAQAPPRPALAEPLPLPAPGWASRRRVTWRAALPELPAAVLASLAADHEPEPVSALTTVVLRVGPWAVKVYPPGTDVAHVEQVRTALAPSGTALLPGSPALATEHGVVTVARWLPASEPVGWADVGALLRRFHDDHRHAPLAAWQPLSRVASVAAWLPEAEAEILMRARDVLLEAVAGTWSELGWGAVHGDVSPFNVMQDAAVPRLIDLDWAALAPREVDLAPVARRLREGEVDAATYLAFCRTYGHDVRGWDGLAALDRVARLGGLAFRIWDCRHHRYDLGWLGAALRDWRDPL